MATSSSRSGDTHQRILAAARDEVVAHGSAGARVDRIAARARTSKERVYFYFSSKAALIAAVAEDNSAAFQNKVKLDIHDVLGFVGALFDYYCSEPDEVRLWLQLLLDVSNEDLPPDDPRAIWLQARADQLRQAQSSGAIDPAWDPVTLLNLLSSLAASRVIAPLYVHRQSQQSLSRHRAVVIDIASRLIREAPAPQ